MRTLTSNEAVLRDRDRQEERGGVKGKDRSGKMRGEFSVEDDTIVPGRGRPGGFKRIVEEGSGVGAGLGGRRTL